jgi:hypothetical protein
VFGIFGVLRVVIDCFKGLALAQVVGIELSLYCR